MDDDDDADGVQSASDTCLSYNVLACAARYEYLSEVHSSPLHSSTLRHGAAVTSNTASTIEHGRCSTSFGVHAGRRSKRRVRYPSELARLRSTVHLRTHTHCYLRRDYCAGVVVFSGLLYSYYPCLYVSVRLPACTPDPDGPSCS